MTRDHINELLGIDLTDPMQNNAEQIMVHDTRLWDALDARREALGWSVSDVARAMGITTASLASLWGYRDMYGSTLRRMAIALGIVIEHNVIVFRDPR